MTTTLEGGGGGGEGEGSDRESHVRTNFESFLQTVGSSSLQSMTVDNLLRGSKLWSTNYDPYSLFVICDVRLAYAHEQRGVDPAVVTRRRAKYLNAGPSVTPTSPDAPGWDGVSCSSLSMMLLRNQFEGEGGAPPPPPPRPQPLPSGALPSGPVTERTNTPPTAKYASSGAADRKKSTMVGLTDNLVETLNTFNGGKGGAGAATSARNRSTRAGKRRRATLKRKQSPVSSPGVTPKRRKRDHDRASTHGPHDRTLPSSASHATGSASSTATVSEPLQQRDKRWAYLVYIVFPSFRNYNVHDLLDLCQQMKPSERVDKIVEFAVEHNLRWRVCSAVVDPKSPVYSETVARIVQTDNLAIKTS